MSRRQEEVEDKVVDNEEEEKESPWKQDLENKCPSRNPSLEETWRDRRSTSADIKDRNIKVKYNESVGFALLCSKS